MERTKYREKNIIKQRTLYYKTPFQNNDFSLHDCYSLLFYYLVDYKVSNVDLDIFDRYSYVGDIIPNSEFLIKDDIIIEKDTNEYRIFKVLPKTTGELYLCKIFSSKDINLFIDYCIYLNQTEYENGNINQHYIQQI